MTGHGGQDTLGADAGLLKRLVDTLSAARADLAHLATTEDSYRSTRLNRTGDAPLVFGGRRLVEVSGKMLGGAELPRWHEIAIHETTAGHYVAAVAYHTTWKGETGHETAIVVTDRNELRDALKRYDPVAHVRGFPPGPQFADKQARLLATTRERWDALVTMALSAIDVEERVE